MKKSIFILFVVFASFQLQLAGALASGDGVDFVEDNFADVVHSEGAFSLKKMILLDGRRTKVLHEESIISCKHFLMIFDNEMKRLANVDEKHSIFNCFLLNLKNQEGFLALGTIERKHIQMYQLFINLGKMPKYPVEVGIIYLGPDGKRWHCARTMLQNEKIFEWFQYQYEQIAPRGPIKDVMKNFLALPRSGIMQQH